MTNVTSASRLQNLLYVTNNIKSYVTKKPSSHKLSCFFTSETKQTDIHANSPTHLHNFNSSVIYPHYELKWNASLPKKSMRVNEIIANVVFVWSSIKRDIVCCGLVSSSISAFLRCYQSYLINCVWNSHNLSYKCHSRRKKTERGLYFNNTFSSFGICCERENFRVYSFEELFKPIIKEAVFDASLCHRFSLYILFSASIKLYQKICFQKDTIRDEIYSLTFFVCCWTGRRKENKLFSFHYMSKQKVSHFKYTLAILRTNDEQKDEKF